MCALCSAFVRFVLRRDRAGSFCFAPLQCSWAQRWAPGYGGGGRPPGAIVVVCDVHSAAPRVLSRSAACLFVLRAIGRPWSALRILDIAPGELLDLGYRSVAALRYRIGGMEPICAIAKASPGKPLDLGQADRRLGWWRETGEFAR